MSSLPAAKSNKGAASCEGGNSNDAKGGHRSHRHHHHHHQHHRKDESRRSRDDVSSRSPAAGSSQKHRHQHHDRHADRLRSCPDDDERPRQSACSLRQQAQTCGSGGNNIQNQIRVSEATRQRIVGSDNNNNNNSNSSDAASTAAVVGSFGTFGRRSPQARERRSRSRSPSRSRSRDSRRRSPNGSSRDSVADIRRGGSDGRLKIDRDQLRRRAVENAVRRLEERSPARLADMPCFKAMGVKASELADICGRLAVSQKEEDKRQTEPAASAAAAVPGLAASAGSSASAAMAKVSRHPFRLRSEAAAGPATSTATSGGAGRASSSSSSSAVVQKKELLAAFPVSSGAFHHRASDHVEDARVGIGSSNNSSSQHPQQQHQQVKQPPPLPLMQTAGIASSAPSDGSASPIVGLVGGGGGGSNGSIAASLLQRVAFIPGQSATEQQQQQQQLLHHGLGDWNTAKRLAPKPQQHEEKQRSKSPQAWVKKHQFLNARPITGGIGHQLMQKMGWRDGQGLGRRNEGPVEPLAIDYKTDRKGLASHEDRVKSRHATAGGKKKSSGGGRVPTTAGASRAEVAAANAAAAAAANAAVAAASGTSLEHLQGKHPICVLVEFARKRRWPEPTFRLMHESGPAHSRFFIFSVKVGSTEYQPTRPSKNKKDAKAMAATVALQQLGVVPKQ